MFEHSSQPILSRRDFIKRVLAFAALAMAVLFVSLLIGIVGYHVTEGLNWTDSLLNASMILGGMGPVNELKTEAGKIFASFYALFSGIVFLVAVGVLIAPILHRLLHQFHLEADKMEAEEEQAEKVEAAADSP